MTLPIELLKNFRISELESRQFQSGSQDLELRRSWRIEQALVVKSGASLREQH
jgi:hypothetical protein